MYNSPIGTIVAWLKSLTSTPALTSEWKECDGTAVSDAASPMNGVNVPNLNGATEATKKFLRGIDGTTGSLGSVYQHNHSVTRNIIGYGSEPTMMSDTSTTSHIPTYYEVVWVIKIK